jgi:SAM-dependent methyltransferase
MAAYDTIGTSYATRRRSDPRIARVIEAALGSAQTIVNVGAGTGSYEPTGRKVVAVEPSAEMIAQRAPGSAPVVQAGAEALPFSNNHFDAAMAVLTIHHWTDPARGLAEMRRVARGPLVIVTYDPDLAEACWIHRYLPQLAELDRRAMPPMDLYAQILGAVNINPLPVPGDCVDGFLHAWWRRPEAYLDPAVRSGSSSFRLLDGLEGGLELLRDELASGEWHRRFGHLLDLQEYDCGYRIVVATGNS